MEFKLLFKLISAKFYRRTQASRHVYGAREDRAKKLYFGFSSGYGCCVKPQWGKTPGRESYFYVE